MADDDGDSDAYTTVAGEGVFSFETRGSEFVGYVARATGDDEADTFVEEVRDEHPDATHHVYAYRVGADDAPLRERHDDDGEPSGSAGKPVLNVLQGEGVENVVAVVVRYYGGTKLGYGGLVRSYSEATKGALGDAGTTRTVPKETVRVEVGYDDSGTVRGIIESEGYDFDAEYGGSVVFVVRPPREHADELRDRILSATSGRARLE
ncbi:MAG: YigZ family protein [Halobacteriales archaeon]|nr:YigZ family protein [Halobacteriales archaeon]